MAIFPTVFLGNIGQENILYDILERKNAFLGYKNKKFKKSKNWHFPKGLSHGFGPNMAIIPTFFVGNIGKKNILYDILERKTPFYSIKTRSSKSRKIYIFSNRLTHGFGPKMGIFATFFFRQYKPEKYPLRYSRTKKRLSRLWKQEVRQVEKLTFFQRG